MVRPKTALPSRRPNSADMGMKWKPWESPQTTIDGNGPLVPSVQACTGLSWAKGRT